MRSLRVCSQFLLLTLLSSKALGQSFCPTGLQPLCPASTNALCSDGSQPHCLNTQVQSTSSQICPKACNPHSNTCDPRTAPTCIFPNPNVPSPRAACACRPGYKATGQANNDVSKHWRLPIPGQQYRVWVAEGVKCDTLCDIPYGINSCGDVSILSDQCISTTGDVIPGESDTETVSISVVELKESPTLSYYQIKDSSMFGSLTLTIPVLLPKNETLLAHFNTDEYLDDVADSIAYALPIVLEQLGVSYAQIVPELNASVVTLTNIGIAMFSPPYRNCTLQARGGLRGLSMKKIKDGVSHVGKEAVKQITAASNNAVKAITQIVPTDVVCPYFATTTLPGYLAEAALVYMRSPGPGVPIFKDQTFFLYPIYGDYLTTKDFRVHYDVGKEKLEMYGAITINHDMYFVAKATLFGPPWLDNTDFINNTRTLIHEMQHTRQYRAHGWSKASFGTTYLLQYCRAGFEYAKIEYEKKADAMEHLMDGLLDDEFGYAFFEFWNIMQLDSVLGYPLDKAPSRSKQYNGQYLYYDLRFQYGVLQGSKGSAASPNDRCFRILTGTVLAARVLLENACEKPVSYSPSCEDFRRRFAEFAAPAPLCLTELRRNP